MSAWRDLGTWCILTFSFLYKCCHHHLYSYASFAKAVCKFLIPWNICKEILVLISSTVFSTGSTKEYSCSFFDSCCTNKRLQGRKEFPTVCWKAVAAHLFRGIYMSVQHINSNYIELHMDWIFLHCSCYNCFLWVVEDMLQGPELLVADSPSPEPAMLGDRVTQVLSHPTCTQWAI